LARAVLAYRAGERDAAALRSEVLAALEARGGVEVEYVELVSADDLEPVSAAGDDTVVAVAARVGKTRLIDNVRLGQPDPGLERLL
jgi:pantoate--beta-alanine ligase